MPLTPSKRSVMLPGHLAPQVYTIVRDPRTGKRRRLTLLQAILGSDARYEDYAFKDGNMLNYRRSNLVRIRKDQ